MEIVKIGKAVPNECVVYEFETLLKRAKEGKIRGFGIVMCLDNDAVVNGFHGELMPTQILGALARMQHRINLDIDKDEAVWDASKGETE
jgi:hypothetical protein